MRVWRSRKEIEYRADGVSSDDCAAEHWRSRAACAGWECAVERIVADNTGAMVPGARSRR